MQTYDSIKGTLSVQNFGNVIPEGYNYYNKLIVPAEPLLIKGACLKWYNLYPPFAELTTDQYNESRSFLYNEAQSGSLNLIDEPGFVILHRAGDYLLLLLSTWRHTNEIWESIFLKKADIKENYQPLKFSSDHKGTYCVWELGIVWHERNAWIDYIKSKRDSEAKQAYLNNLFSGEV